VVTLFRGSASAPLRTLHFAWLCKCLREQGQEKTMNRIKKITGVAAVFCLGSMMPVFGQKDEKKDQPQQHAQQPQQHAPEARQGAPPQQPQQRVAPAQTEQRARQPQQHAQKAQAPAQQSAKPSPMRQPNQSAQPVQHQQARASQAVPAPRVQVPVRAQQQQPQRSAKDAQSWQQQRGWTKQGGGWQPHTNFQQGRDQNWASDHRSWAQRGGYGGSYIAQTSFGLYFGSSHSFHIGVMPVMYMGYPRFSYSGYSFLLLDPWPDSWQEDWYASDDVYIDYSDGYYLHDRRHPGINLAISIAL
jgi:hypothetical protein